MNAATDDEAVASAGRSVEATADGDPEANAGRSVEAPSDSDAASTVGRSVDAADDDPVARAGRWVDAADDGDPVALRELGAALDGLRQCADRGDRVAQRTLGFVLQRGVGVPADPERATELFRAAAASGDPWAAYNLGELAGRSAESISWLRVAAEAGLVPAFPALADRLGEHDLDEEALGWYVKGAEAGDKGSMFAAACWYRDGFGGPVDLVQALRWYLAMLNVGSGDGIHEAHQIVPAMSHEQIRTAGRLAGRTVEAEIFIS